MLCIMAKRHGGEKPWFLPYGERSEASPRKNFTAGERWRESARERSERACSSVVEHPPYKRKVGGSIPPTPTKRAVSSMAERPLDVRKVVGSNPTPPTCHKKLEN